MLKENSFWLRHKRKIIIFLSCCVLVAIGFYAVGKFNKKSRFSTVSAAEREVVSVSSGDITKSITGSGTIKSASTKNISSEVSADVLKVNVAVGDKVSQGDVLIELDKKDYETKIRELNNNISKLSNNVNSYKEDIANLYVYADKVGYVSDLNLQVGDSVNKNSNLFNIINDEYFYITCQVNYSNNLNIQVGDKAKMMLVDSFSYLDGEVSYVSDLKERNGSGVPLQSVEIKVKNPGYTLENLEVSITISTSNGDIKAVNNSTIDLEGSKSIKAKSSGNIKELNVRNGDYINVGDLIMVLENDDLQDNLTDAKSSLNDAYEDLNNEKSNLDFYTITAPIDGIITNLNVAQGDYVKSEASLLTIVNNNNIEFDIEVDELDINDVSLNQEVEVTIDALEETASKPLIGKVSNISIEGNSMNNVTSYPVTISLTGNDNIKMGMNCSAEIIIESREDVLTVPVEAVSTRKNKYFVTMEDGSQRDIEVGLYDEDYIEIVSGLSIGEKILLPETVKSSASVENNKNMMNMPGGMMGGGNFGGNMERPQGGGNYGGGRPNM